MVWPEVWKIEPSPDCKNAMFAPSSGCGIALNNSMPVSTDGPDAVQPGILLQVASPTVLAPTGSSKLALTNAIGAASVTPAIKPMRTTTNAIRYSPRVIGTHLPQ